MRVCVGQSRVGSRKHCSDADADADADVVRMRPVLIS